MMDYYNKDIIIVKYPNYSRWTQDKMISMMQDTILFVTLSVALRLLVIAGFFGWPGWRPFVFVLWYNSLLTGLCAFAFSLLISTLALWWPSKYASGFGLFYIILDYGIFLYGGYKIYIPHSLYFPNEGYNAVALLADITILAAPVVILLAVNLLVIKRIDFLINPVIGLTPILSFAGYAITIGVLLSMGMVTIKQYEFYG